MAPVCTAWYGEGNRVAHYSPEKKNEGKATSYPDFRRYIHTSK